MMESVDSLRDRQSRRGDGWLRQGTALEAAWDDAVLPEDRNT